jgi:hypothetical protein
MLSRRRIKTHTLQKPKSAATTAKDIVEGGQAALPAAKPLVDELDSISSARKGS